MVTIRSVAGAVLRVIIALVAIVGSIVLVRWVVVPGLQSTLHLGEATASVIRRVGILAVAVAAYWGYVRVVEKRAVTEIRFAPVAIPVGLASGAALISITTLVLFAAGIYEVVSVRGVSNDLAGMAFVILTAATLEEIVFRGVLFRIAEGALGTLPALCLMSFVFAVVHLPNVEGSGATTAVTMVVSVTLIGAFWTMIFVHTRNLWVAAVNHAAWNFAILLTGLPLSGKENWGSAAPFQSRYHGPEWLSGGMFGPESSVITIGIVVISLGALLYWARRANRFLPPAPGA